MQKNKDQALPAPILLHGSETWTIGVHEHGHLSSVSTRARVDRVIRKAGMNQVHCMMRHRQIRLFDHVARLLRLGLVNRGDP